MWPEILTVNDKAAVVIQDAETYEKMASMADYAESIQNIRQAMPEQGRPLDEFTTEFEARHGISRWKNTVLISSQPLKVILRGDTCRLINKAQHPQQPLYFAQSSYFDSSL